MKPLSLGLSTWCKCSLDDFVKVIVFE